VTAFEGDFFKKPQESKETLILNTQRENTQLGEEADERERTGTTNDERLAGEKCSGMMMKD